MHMDFILIKFLKLLSLNTRVIFHFIVLIKTAAFAILMLHFFHSFNDTSVQFLIFFGAALVHYFSMINLKTRILKEFN